MNRDVKMTVTIDMPDASRKEYKFLTKFAQEMVEQWGRGIVEIALRDVERNLEANS